MKPLFFLLITLAGLSASAQIPVTNTSVYYVQNFDSLDPTGTGLTNMPAGWSFFEWGGSTANATYRASPGSSTTGDTYSYGLTGSSDRALGSLCSSGLPNVSYGMRFVNQTGTYLNAVDISFKAEQWRRNGSGKTDSTLFYYATFAGAGLNDTSFSNWTLVPELLMTSVTTALPAAAVNGNDTSKLLSFQLPLSLAPGDTICFRWYDYNAVASDDGLAIDSLKMTFNVGVPPGLFRPKVLNLYPEPGKQGVSPSVVPYIVFDRKIRKGSTGAVYIKDRSTQLVQSLTVGASKLYISGDTAKFYLLNLQSGRTYQVTFDSTTFDTAGFHCMGMYDTSAWTFTTESSTAVNSLSEKKDVSIVNPVKNGVLRIDPGCFAEKRWNLMITDMQGQLVLNRMIDSPSASETIDLELELLPGVYVLNIVAGSDFVRKKILVE